MKCQHPKDAIKWNKWNKVTQCHVCGEIIDNHKKAVLRVKRDLEKHGAEVTLRD